MLPGDFSFIFSFRLIVFLLTHRLSTRAFVLTISFRFRSFLSDAVRIDDNAPSIIKVATCFSRYHFLAGKSMSRFNAQIDWFHWTYTVGRFFFLAFFTWKVCEFEEFDLEQEDRKIKGSEVGFETLIITNRRKFYGLVIIFGKLEFFQIFSNNSVIKFYLLRNFYFYFYWK